tara:strand:+ start:2060 stop:2623 length:564 start_codon:yes stop_codon:yes gene_type:complete
MSIKQNGGVFGRNPTFNYVTFRNLDVTGAANLASLNVTTGISSLSIVDTANSAVSYPIKASHLPSGTTGNGLGVGIDFSLKNSTYSNIQQIATIEAVSVSEGEIANNLVFRTKWNATDADRLVLRGRGGVNGVVDLDVRNGNLILTTASTPASASASGAIGMITWDASYIYVCTATNTWKRIAISTW